MPYATRAEMRLLLNTPATDTADDALIDVCLTRAESLIDEYTRTIRSSFVKFEAVTLTKHFHGDGERLLEIPDLLTITSVAVDTASDGTYATAVASSAYWLPDVQPYNWIELTGRGATTYWAEGRRSVRIIGTWGYATTVPDAVKQATLEEAIRLFKGRAAGFSDAVGVAGDGGVVLSKALSARTKLVLQSYARWIFA